MASAGITLGEKTGWFGALRWRYLGASPLTEDNAFRSPPTSIVNGRVGYRFDNGWRVQLDALNLLDSKTNQITYAYGSLIKTDNLFAACLSATPPPAAVCQTGVMDRVLHPIEPLAVAADGDRGLLVPPRRPTWNHAMTVGGPATKPPPMKQLPFSRA